jgi:DNA polymerase III subunit delta'
VSFASIEGHEKAIGALKRALGNKTLAHAYVFSGDAGLGKKMTALALAAAVNCPAAGPDGGCGECPSCRRTARQSHPDVHVLAPDGNELKIDQIRKVQAELSLKPFEGARKALIMDGAESMNTAASNAFLKTLEEPPGDVLIILITPTPRGLLPTIRSRCQEIRFHPLPRRILAPALMRKRGLSEEDAWFLAALAQGSMGRGLEMDADQEKESRTEVMALWTGLAGAGPAGTLARAESLSKDRELLDRVLDIGVEWLRDTLVYRETGDERLLVYGQERDLRREWTERFPIPRMLADLELFIASRDLLDRRVSAQLVAENLLLKLGRA